MDQTFIIVFLKDEMSVANAPTPDLSGDDLRASK